MKDFKSLGLSQPLLEAIDALGFEQPTPIQVQAIPALLQGNTDLVGLAQTGTGKTAAFGLPLLQLIDPQINTTQALILAPTRELCIQITKEMENFARKLHKIKIRPVYGGTNVNQQIKSVKAGVHVIVATPGRLKDLQNRKVVDLKALRILVLDEADEMLNMGFKPEIDHILRGTSDDKLTWLFSATMPREVQQISEEYMSDPLELSVGQRNASNTDIDHRFVRVNRRERYDALTRFLDSDDAIFGLVFCRTRRDTKKLAKKLKAADYRTDALHGDLTQGKRDKVMGKFRRQELQVLIATDVAARGIDVQNITHVFHYNIPEDLSFYTHRSGRTGRAGQKGISVVFAESRDRHLLRQLEKLIKAKFTEIDLPDAAAIATKQKAGKEQQLRDWLQTFRNIQVNGTQAYLETIAEALGGMSKKDILLRIGALAFEGKKTGKQEPMKKQKTYRGAFKKLFINIGSMDVKGKGDFINLIASRAVVDGRAIGKIEMNRKHSFFEVVEEVAGQVIDRLDKGEIGGRDIRVNEGERLAGEKHQGKKGRKKKVVRKKRKR